MQTRQSDRCDFSNESLLPYCMHQVEVNHLNIQPLYITIRMLISLFLFPTLACDLAYISWSCSLSHQYPDNLFPKIPGVLLTEPFLSNSWNFSDSLLEALWGASCSPRSGRLSAHETVVTGCYQYESGSSPLLSGLEVFCHIRIDSTGNYLLQIQRREHIQDLSFNHSNFYH